jgi:hypothetical protein
LTSRLNLCSGLKELYIYFPSVSDRNIDKLVEPFREMPAIKNLSKLRGLSVEVVCDEEALQDDASRLSEEMEQPE